MKKRALLTVVIVAVLLSVALIIGASAPTGKRVNVAIEYDGVTVLDKEYRLDFVEVTRATFLYNGRYDVLSQKRYLGNDKECLRSLNSDLYDDIINLASELSFPAVDAECAFNDGVFTYTEEKEGRRIDADKMFSDLLSSLQKDTRIIADSTPLYPDVDLVSLKERTQHMSTFYTVLTGSENRKKNIALATKRINNACVYCGDVFSFNERVGERTEDNGFLLAHIIKDGEFVDGVGGGVCQASTTVYNAWLYAGLAVERATAHSLPVSYVPPSQDAMVSSASDLVLYNDSRFPVYIWARCDNNKMYVSIYGAPCGYEVKIRSKKLKTLPAKYDLTDEGISWNEGEKERVIKRAKDGLVSESYRDFYLDGELIKTEKLRTNEYKPQNGIKAIRTDG